MHDYLNRARALSGELCALRRELHMWPELGNREFETAKRIEARLAAWGIESRRPLDTAVVARIRGGRPGRVAALRADMDALPMTEATGVEFASRNPGVMHACGHDVHMTAALGAARMLAEHREDLAGDVVLLFEPDEERYGGARRLIEAGALDGVDAVFGAHVSPDLPAGSVGVRYGKFYAASNPFRIAVIGKSAHGAEREKGVDALGAAAALAVRLIGLPGTLPPGERAVVSVGTFHAGEVQNALAGRAELAGIMRTLGPDARKAIVAHFRQAVDEVTAAWGATADVELWDSYPGVVNHDGMTALAEEAAKALLGADRVRRIEQPTLTTEDFGYFLDVCPGTYYHIGAGCEAPLHNTAFLPADEAIVTAAAVHAAVVERFLNP